MSGRYAARNRRSVPIELPHNGTLAGSGTCCLMNSSVAAPAASKLTVGRLDLFEQTRLRVHVDHERVHRREHLVGLVDDEVGTFGDDRSDRRR